MKKIIPGFVIQHFNEKNQFVGQYFIAGEPVEYEDDAGNSIDEPDCDLPYVPLRLSVGDLK